MKQISLAPLVFIAPVVVLFLSTCCYHPMRPPLDDPEPVGVSAPTTDPELPDYNRSEWGRWIDADKDCRDTRQEVLADESLDPVQWDERGCRVLSGRWKCSYTGKTIAAPGLLDIDHVVALREAHVSGGWNWAPEKKKAYFNNLSVPDNLIAVDRSANRSKGSRTPLEWLPANVAFRCTYVRSWVKLKRHFGLDMTCSEAEGVARLMADYCR